MKKIVIIGGGAGGIELATRLGRKLGKNNKAQVTLIDKNPHHLWKPLLHELATGALDDGVAALNYLAHAKRNYFYFQQGTLTQVDRATKTVHLAALYDNKGEQLLPARSLQYDKLVLAIGSVSNDFNTPGVKDHCIFLDNPVQAKRFHEELLNLYLRLSAQPEKRQVNIAIVGGGATGVELSAELHSTIKELHSYGYRHLDNSILNVTLVEAGERILPVLPERISKTITNKLTQIGVNVLTQTMVVSADKTGLTTKAGDHIETDLMVWAAGIKAPEFLAQIDGLETNRINQIMIKDTLQTTQDNDIFALGDCASCPNPKGGFIPPRAQAAHQMATLCAKNVIASLQDKPLKSFKFTDKGTMVSLAGYSAVGSLLGNLSKDSVMVEGWFARMIYKSIYRMHQRVLHGSFKTGVIMLIDKMNRIIKPKVKLH